MAKQVPHKWEFRSRFRRQAFGWKSQPAIKRIKEAVSEIKKVARKDKVTAAEGAVLFLEKVSPAIEQVDSSSGAIGTAVNQAVAALAGIIASAPVQELKRQKWLERLFQAHAEDQIPYIEQLADHWGEMCASPEVASRWADELMAPTRIALDRSAKPRSHFHATSACLTSLYAAARFEELLVLLEDETFWPYKRWAAMALAAMGKNSDAVQLAESSRSPWASDEDIDQFCEQVLLSTGEIEEAYARYGPQANRASTYTAWFRKISRKYPHKSPAELFEDLAEHTPGEEGKWFAAAKDAELFDEAIALAQRSPCSPQTLTRAARDFNDSHPSFAVESGVAALRWIVDGYGYDITSVDVRRAYSHSMTAAAKDGSSERVRDRIRRLLQPEKPGADFVAKSLEHELGMP